MATSYRAIEQNPEETDRDTSALASLDLLNETIKQLDKDIIEAEENLWLIDQTKKYHQHYCSGKFVGEDVLNRASKRLYVLIRTRVECYELRKGITRSYIHNMIWDNIGNAKL